MENRGKEEERQGTEEEGKAKEGTDENSKAREAMFVTPAAMQSVLMAVHL